MPSGEPCHAKTATRPRDTSSRTATSGAHPFFQQGAWVSLGMYYGYTICALFGFAITSGEASISAI